MPKKKALPLAAEIGKEGSELHRTRLNNGILDIVREEGDTLATHIAETRWLMLEMTRMEHAQAAGINTHAQRNAERTNTHPVHHTYSSIYRLWVREKIKKDICEKLIHLLMRRGHEWRGETFKKDEFPEPSIVDLYRSWSYRVGLDKFEKASAHINDGKPILYGALWQRRANGIVADFSEVKQLAASLKMDGEEAAKVWTGEKSRQLESRGLPAPYCKFLLRLEQGRSLSTTTGSRADLDVTSEIRKKIAHTEFVPFSAIAKVAANLFTKGELKTLREEWQKYSSSDDETPGDAFDRIRDASGLTNRQLSVALNIRPPEKLRRGYETNRKETYRPSHQIRETWNHPQFSRQAPAGVLAGLVASTDYHDESRNDPEGNAYLQKLFTTARENVYRSKGGKMDDRELRILREYWGVEPAEILCVIPGITAIKLLQAERGVYAIGADQRKKLIQAILKHGHARIALARGKLEEAERMRQDIPASLEDFVPCMQRRTGSFLAIRRAINAQSEHYEGISIEMLKTYGTAEGKVLPALVRFKKIAMACGLEDFPDRLRREWYDYYPDVLYDREERPVKNPLARGFETLVATKTPNLRQFQACQMPNLAYSSIIRNFQDMEEGNYPPWPSVGRYLGACDVSVSDPLFIYLKALHSHNGDVEKALQEWRKTAKHMDLRLEEHEYTFGLTLEERKEFSVRPGLKEGKEGKGR